MNRVSTLALLWACLLTRPLAAPSLDWHRSGAAGGQATDGSYRLRGAAGQAEATVAEGGGYRLTGGFWHPVALGLTGVTPPQITGLTLIPASGTPGENLHARGAVAPAGSVGLSVYWEQGGVLRLVGRGSAAADGSFDLPAVVPTDADTSPASIAVLAEGGAPGDFASAAFSVVLPPPGRVSGVVRNAAGTSVGAGIPVRLAGPDGLAVANTITDGNGSYVFADAPPGPHRVEVLTDGYPPQTVEVASGQGLVLDINQAGVGF